MSDESDKEPIDAALLVAMARLAERVTPPPPKGARERLLARLRALSPLSAGSPEGRRDMPEGFSMRTADDEGWMPHPVSGIRMKVLAVNTAAGYATLLLDVPPNTRFPAHHHSGAEDCYVLSGSLVTCGRRLAAGDFIHADAGTAHDELWTDEGCRVLLIAPPGEHGLLA